MNSLPKGFRFRTHKIKFIKKKELCLGFLITDGEEAGIPYFSNLLLCAKFYEIKYKTLLL